MDILLEPDRDHERWRALLGERLARGLPGARLRRREEIEDATAVAAAVVWRPAPDFCAALPNLRCVMALGAGVEDLVSLLPAGMPLTRVVDRQLTDSMTEYVLLHVLRYHRNQPAHAADQQHRTWQPRGYPPARERTVGILGMGVLGTDAAARLVALGFRVLGWSRARKHVPGVESLCGPDGLDVLLGQSHVVVCLLPLTAETADILDARAFARMRRGAYLINAARGAHVVDEDLIAALDAGQLAGATLDVFRQEPLPPAHPFWAHPRVTMTPHVASLTDPASVADQICENLRRLHAGEPLLHQVDRALGY